MLSFGDSPTLFWRYSSLKVAYIRPSNTKGYLRIGISRDAGDLSLTVSEREYSEAGSPLIRDALDEYALSVLLLSDERYRARSKALRVLSYGDNSEGVLMRKLAMAGISRDIAEETVREMVSRGYVNSHRQLEKLITNEVNLKNSGPLKLIPKLISKGYKKSEITEVIEELESSGEIDFDAARERLLRGVPTEDAKKILYKNGFVVC